MVQTISRRPRRTGRLRRAVASVLVVLTSGVLRGAGAGDGRDEVRFVFSKREAIGFMTDLVAEYNASQDDARVVLDTSGVDVVSASFVRGNPPDIALANYNMESARFVQRGALSDLSDTEAATRIRPDLQPLMDQYGSYPGRTSALPRTGVHRPMPMPAADIERMIKARFPDAQIVLKDLAGDNDHWAAHVVSAAFKGKTRVQQHQMVYDALGGNMGNVLHALQLTTARPPD